MGKIITWKYGLLSWGAAFGAAAVCYGEITGPDWANLFSDSAYLSLFSMLVGCSYLTLKSIDWVCEWLNGQRWAMENQHRRMVLQAAFGVVGVGLVMYGLKWLLFDWLAGGALALRLGPASWTMLLLLVCMANLLVMYARGVWEFKYTGATPKNAYLNHLLATDGTVPANQIRFCYHYKHKINRIRLRGGEQRSDPIVDDTFKNMIERLDPEEFMEVRSGLIIHQSAIVDDGRMQRNGNRRVELVEPYEKYDKGGDCSQVKRVDVPKRRVSAFHEWRTSYRQSKKNEIKR